MKKDILLVTNYYHFEHEKSSSRYRTLAEMIAADDSLTLEVVTSSFCHLKKCFRSEMQEELEKLPFKVTMIRESGYKKNISVKRLQSCRVFAKNVLAYLKTRKKPDLIYLVVPSLDVADAVSRFAEDNNIPLMLDIQDLWPEAFRMALNIPVVSDIVFMPMLKKANRIYSRADQIVAVSDTYAERGCSVNKKCKQGISAYIGTDIAFANNLMKDHVIEKPQNEFWLTYVGALGHSYDLGLVIDALALVKERGIANIVFHVFGSGVLMESFRQAAENAGVSAVFHGQTEYGRMMAFLSKSDAAVNPIVKESVSTIINKVSDYAVAGTPVINTQNSQEYRDLLDKYSAGINCISGDKISVADAIEKLYRQEELRTSMKANSLKLADERFDRRRTYQKLVDRMKEMAQ